jgi:hypothetical protein
MNRKTWSEDKYSLICGVTQALGGNIGIEQYTHIVKTTILPC